MWILHHAIFCNFVNIKQIIKTFFVYFEQLFLVFYAISTNRVPLF